MQGNPCSALVDLAHAQICSTSHNNCTGYCTTVINSAVHSTKNQLIDSVSQTVAKMIVSEGSSY